MMIEALMFYLLAALILIFSVSVVLAVNPIYSALSLVLTMIMASFVYFLLEAPFLAAVQLAVYGGAVLVLFVMVIMLFDLKKEKAIFSSGRISTILKISSCGWLAGLVGGAIFMSTDMINISAGKLEDPEASPTKALAKLLFTDYVFSFELLGLLLLLIAVGVVAVSRSRGGTHAKY